MARLPGRLFIDVDTSGVDAEIEMLDEALQQMPVGTSGKLRKAGRRPRIADAWQQNWSQIWNKNMSSWADMNSEEWNEEKEKDNSVPGNADTGMFWKGIAFDALMSRSMHPKGGWNIRTNSHIGGNIQIVSPPRQMIPDDKDERPLGPIFYWGGYLRNIPEPRRWKKVLDPTVSMITDVVEEAALEAIEDRN